MIILIRPNQYNKVANILEEIGFQEFFRIWNSTCPIKGIKIYRHKEYMKIYHLRQCDTRRIKFTSKEDLIVNVVAWCLGIS